MDNNQTFLNGIHSTVYEVGRAFAARRTNLEKTDDREILQPEHPSYAYYGIVKIFKKTRRWQVIILIHTCTYKMFAKVT